MPWVISFVISWIVFLSFVDTKRIKYTIYGGIITIFMATVVDWAGQQLNLYEFSDNVIVWAGNSLFYILGPVFTMGVLFFQFLQRDRILQTGNVVVFSLAYLAVESLIISANVARYINWHYLASFFVDILVFTTLSFFGEIILDRVEGGNQGSLLKK